MAAGTVARWSTFAEGGCRLSETFGCRAGAGGADAAVISPDWQSRRQHDSAGDAMTIHPGVHALAFSQSVARRHEDAEVVRALPPHRATEIDILPERIRKLDALRYPDQHVAHRARRRAKEAATP